MQELELIFGASPPISERAIDLYFNAFKYWSVENFIKACKKIVTTRKFPTFPLPAEIMECEVVNSPFPPSPFDEKGNLKDGQ